MRSNMTALSNCLIVTLGNCRPFASQFITPQNCQPLCAGQFVMLQLMRDRNGVKDYKSKGFFLCFV